MNHDEERIAKRVAALPILQELHQNRAVSMIESIQLHDECGGKGYLVKEGEVTDYHKREYSDPERRECVYCAGTGRVLVVTVELKLPYEEKMKRNL